MRRALAASARLRGMSATAHRTVRAVRSSRNASSDGTRKLSAFQVLPDEDTPGVVAPGSLEHLDSVERRLERLFQSFGASDYIGEPISVVEHSVQASLAARERGENEEVQVAALLHDIGHLLGFEAGFPAGMDGCGTEFHEDIGADFLRGLGLSESICYYVQNHVAAKRYLCWKDPEYYASLTSASRTTLRHQGGPMSDEEAAAAEADPRWSTAVLMRSFDEVAKDPAVVSSSIRPFLPDIRRQLESHATALRAEGRGLRPHLLSREQQRRWEQDGFLVVQGALAPPVLQGLEEMADQLPGQRHDGMLVHYEVPDGAEGVDEKRLCRVENFCKHVPRWGALCFGVVQDLVSQVYGEPAVLFKDKLNYKGPGGAGFLAHQDATAYATDDLASRHVSVMVAVDPSTRENGCLEVAAGRHREGVLPHQHGIIHKALEESMVFSDVLAEPGDLVLFDSYLPHRSKANTTAGWRRLAYLTFNPAGEGDHHAAYYEKKKSVMKEGAISINLDFAGRIV
eukprot:CAMPEP_0118976016 /NCGR_PEP_ID=MMETSP1173-20130426/17557_1 /TAXON_ID=1034831 /ORGANISM="Rhizochromulina marina cf, Strain CCMP1243" /LENGTH=511 /DNA_ID=CAMNT_0006925993 /DNA_START=11 /DNA_END=1542 /DNA_ORIENTATION=-